MAKFIITHKQFDLPLEQYQKEQYTVLAPKGTTIENWPNIIYFESNLDNRVWSELSAMDWIYRNVQSEWIEINHYRRLLDTYYNHICVPKAIYLTTNLANHYNITHNIQDLSIVSNIIKQRYPAYYNDWMANLQTNIFRPYNMCSFPIQIYRDYMTVIMTILYDYCNIVKCHTYEDFVNKTTNEPIYTQKTTVDKNTDTIYQARIPGFLSERISSWFYKLLTIKGEIVYPCEINYFECAY